VREPPTPPSRPTHPLPWVTGAEGWRDADGEGGGGSSALKGEGQAYVGGCQQWSEEEGGGPPSPPRVFVRQGMGGPPIPPPRWKVSRIFHIPPPLVPIQAWGGFRLCVGDTTNRLTESYLYEWVDPTDGVLGLGVPLFVASSGADGRGPGGGPLPRGGADHDAVPDALLAGRCSPLTAGTRAFTYLFELQT